LVQKEVIEPMTKIGWSHSAPPAPDYSNTTSTGTGQPAPAEGAPGQAAAPAPAPTAGQPAPKAGEQPAPTDKPKANGPTAEDGATIIALYESLRDPATGLIAGKYKTVSEAIKGSGHLANMAKQAFRERDEAKARQVAPAPAATAPAASPVAAPTTSTASPTPSREKLDAAQARYDEVLSSVVENGGVLDAEAKKSLSKAQRELSEAAAEFTVQKSRSEERNALKAEQDQWAEADAYMREHHPESAKFSEEAALYIQSEPLLAAAVNALLAQGKRTEATVLAWKEFARTHSEMLSSEERAKAEVKESDLAAREQVRQEQVAAARRDAGVVNGSPGGSGVHERGNAGASAEEIAAMRDRMVREGEAPGSPAAMRFRQMVIGPSLDPRFFPGQ
jgi:hypothetical protein